MNELAAQDVLELELTNFGPIVEAKIDLRPLTVFVGAEQHRKILFGNSDLCTAPVFQWWRLAETPAFFSESMMFRNAGAKKLSKKVITDFTAFAGNMVVNEDKSVFDEGIVIPSSVAEVMRSGFRDQGEYLGNEVRRCFGIEEARALIRKGTKDATRIVLRRDNAAELAPIDHRLTISAHASDFETIIPEDVQMWIRGGNGDYPVDHLRRVAMEMISTSDREEEPKKFFCVAAVRGSDRSCPSPRSSVP